MIKEFIDIRLETINNVTDFLKPYLTQGITIALIGELGAGKTFLTAGLAKIIGFNNIFASPTFTLLNQYSHPEKKYLLNHFDMYRINSADELEYLGFFDYINNPDCINIIEWADKIKEQLPKNNLMIINIDFSKLHLTARNYTIILS